MIFDADGVIVRPRSWFVTKAQRHYRIPKAQFMAFIDGDFKRCTTGELEWLEILRAWLERFGVRVSPEVFVRDWLEHERALDQALLREIARLRATGLRCYLGTNQERNRARYMRETMGLGAILDGVFASCELGARKPDAAFYERIQAQLNLPPNQLLLWDDSSRNVAAARAAGWRAEVYTSLLMFRRRCRDVLPT